MSPVVERLRDDHRFMLQLLVGASVADAEERRIRLAHARAALVAHIAREEAEIYRPLEEADATSAIAHRFDHDMSRMGPRLIQILDHAIDQPDAEEVPFVIHQVFDALRERINAEELLLYPAYEAAYAPANEPMPEEIAEVA